MARSSKKGMKKVKKKKMDRPFLLHVKPTSSDDSFDMTRQASQDCNSLIGCNDHSNLLLPAMVLVPPLSGVRNQLHVDDDCGQPQIMSLGTRVVRQVLTEFSYRVASLFSHRQMLPPPN